MVSYYEDRGRCYINKKRYIDRRMFFLTLLFSFIMSFFLLLFVDNRLNTILDNYIDSEIDKISSIVVNYAINKVNSNHKDSYLIVQKKDNIIENISYNTSEINEFRDELVEVIQNEFNAIESGDFSHFHLAHQEKYHKKYPYLKSGYLCEVNFNSVHKSTLFANLGPAIPIKLSFMGFVRSDVDVKVKEYGINNVIIEVDIIVVVSNLITMPISSRTHEVETRNVLSIEVIRGEIPNYYNGVLR